MTTWPSSFGSEYSGSDGIDGGSFSHSISLKEIK
jgi:hypothetical protein